MRLKEGDKAKNFNIIDIFGNTISMDDYKEKKLLISFYRYASCPLCNLRIHNLIQKYNEYNEKGLFIISFFESPKESIMEYVGKQNPPFPIIPDPERDIYKLYGVEYSLWKYIKAIFSRNLYEALKTGFKFGKIDGNKTLVPADFLIDNLIIKQAYYGKDISDHIPIEDIEKFTHL